MADHDEDASHLRAHEEGEDADEGEESAGLGSWTRLMCVGKHPPLRFYGSTVKSP